MQSYRRCLTWLVGSITPEKPVSAVLFYYIFFRLHVNSLLEDKRKTSFLKYTGKSSRHTTRGTISNLKKNPCCYCPKTVDFTFDYNNRRYHGLSKQVTTEMSTRRITIALDCSKENRRNIVIFNVLLRSILYAFNAV